MRIDPRLVEIARRQQAARDAYDVHIRQFAHPIQWPLLDEQKQREWYASFTVM